MAIESHELKIDTTGSAGSASGSGIISLPISELVAIFFNYHASAPAATDVTVTAPGNPGALVILTVSNAVADGWFYPKVQDHGNTGSAITGSYSHPIIHRNLLIEVAQADALTDALIATVFVRP